MNRPWHGIHLRPGSLCWWGVALWIVLGLSSAGAAPRTSKPTAKEASAAQEGAEGPAASGDKTAPSEKTGNDCTAVLNLLRTYERTPPPLEDTEKMLLKLEQAAKSSGKNGTTLTSAEQEVCLAQGREGYANLLTFRSGLSEDLVGRLLNPVSTSRVTIAQEGAEAVPNPEKAVGLDSARRALTLLESLLTRQEPMVAIKGALAQQQALLGYTRITAGQIEDGSRAWHYALWLALNGSAWEPYPNLEVTLAATGALQYALSFLTVGSTLDLPTWSSLVLLARLGAFYSETLDETDFQKSLLWGGAPVDSQLRLLLEKREWYAMTQALPLQPDAAGSQLAGALLLRIQLWNVKQAEALSVDTLEEPYKSLPNEVEVRSWLQLPGVSVESRIAVIRETLRQNASSRSGLFGLPARWGAPLAASLSQFELQPLARAANPTLQQTGARATRSLALAVLALEQANDAQKMAPSSSEAAANVFYQIPTNQGVFGAISGEYALNEAASNILYLLDAWNKLVANGGTPKENGATPEKVEEAKQSLALLVQAVTGLLLKSKVQHVILDELGLELAVHQPDAASKSSLRARVVEHTRTLLENRNQELPALLGHLRRYLTVRDALRLDDSDSRNSALRALTSAADGTWLAQQLQPWTTVGGEGIKLGSEGCQELKELDILVNKANVPEPARSMLANNNPSAPGSPSNQGLIDRLLDLRDSQKSFCDDNDPPKTFPRVCTGWKEVPTEKTQPRQYKCMTLSAEGQLKGLRRHTGLILETSLKVKNELGGLGMLYPLSFPVQTLRQALLEQKGLSELPMPLQKELTSFKEVCTCALRTVSGTALLPMLNDPGAALLEPQANPQCSGLDQEQTLSPLQVRLRDAKIKALQTVSLEPDTAYFCSPTRLRTQANRNNQNLAEQCRQSGILAHWLNDELRRQGDTLRAKQPRPWSTTLEWIQQGDWGVPSARQVPEKQTLDTEMAQDLPSSLAKSATVGTTQSAYLLVPTRLMLPLRLRQNTDGKLRFCPITSKILNQQLLDIQSGGSCERPLTLERSAFTQPEVQRQ